MEQLNWERRWRRIVWVLTVLAVVPVSVVAYFQSKVDMETVEFVTIEGRELDLSEFNQRVDIPEVGPVYFPSTLQSDEISVELAKRSLSGSAVPSAQELNIEFPDQTVKTVHVPTYVPQEKIPEYLKERFSQAYLALSFVPATSLVEANAKKYEKGSVQRVSWLRAGTIMIAGVAIIAVAMQLLLSIAIRTARQSNQTT